MESLLFAVSANIFIEYSETIFAVIPEEVEVNYFLYKLNHLHPTLKFKVEKQNKAENSGANQ